MSLNSTFSSPELFTADRTNNATPSPSAIPNLPLPDPLDTLKNKEVFLEAVASLSHASEILTAAARAMSDAAKSLALAGTHSDCANLFLRRNVPSHDEEISQEWLKRSYNLDRAAEDMSGQRTLSPPITELFPGMSLSPPKRPELPFGHISTSSLPSKNLDVDGILPAKLVSPGIKQSVAQQSTTVSLPQTSSPSSEVLSSSFSEDDHSDSDDGESVPEATTVETHHQFTQELDIIPPVNEPDTDLSSSESSPHSFVRSLNNNSDEESSSEASDSDDSDESAQNSLPQISGRYIILEEDFDVIPLVCHIATLRPNENTLCFVKDVKMMQTLQTMIEEIMPKPICMLVPEGPRGPKKAAGRLCESSEGCLIFCSAFSTPLPKCIRHQSFHSVIHVGWAKTEELFEEQRDRPDLQRATLILTKEECSEHMLTDEDLRLEGYARCPSTDVYNNLGSHKKLSEIRKQWKERLRNSYGDLCHTFEAWIAFHYSGPHKVTRWSATDVATYANTFAKKTLLHGNAKVLPRYPQRPTIGRRLSVTSQFASDLGLEEPVKSKILVVEEFDE